MTWPEVDLAAREWVIPAARSKNGEPHVVPLSDQAVAVLEAVPRIKGKANYVFTTDSEHPVSGFSRMKKRIDKLMAGYAAEIEATIPAWTIHDIRRTVAAGMQRIGIKIEVTEKVLTISRVRSAGSPASIRSTTMPTRSGLHWRLGGDLSTIWSAARAKQTS